MHHVLHYPVYSRRRALNLMAINIFHPTILPSNADCPTSKNDCSMELEIIWVEASPSNCEVKVKQSRNRPGVAQRVPRSLASQISMTFGTWRWWVCQPHAPAAFTSRKCSWYSFSLGAESTPGPWYGRKEYVTGKSGDTTGNRSQDRPTSSAAP